MTAAPHRLDLAVIPGDGIGPEVTAEAVKVLRAAVGNSVEIALTEYELGAEHWLATGETLPDATLEELRRHDAILFGAVGAAPGDTRIPSGLIEREFLLKLRFSLDHFVNLRPSKLYSGVPSPLGAPGVIDFVVVREGTEGPYTGNGGTLRGGTPQEVATEVSLNTAYGVERVVRDAFARASTRSRKKLTLVHKHNVLVHAGHLWKRTVEAVAAEFPEVAHDYLHVDAAMIFLVTDPSRFDVIVTDNLFGDILSDQASMLTGSIGMLPSASLDTNNKGMYEPCHGSAPDIAGKGIANPLATILSVSMMLRYSFNLTDAADAIEKAVSVVLDQGLRTGDIFSTGNTKVGTQEMGDAVVAALRNL